MSVDRVGRPILVLICLTLDNGECNAKKGAPKGTGAANMCIAIEYEGSEERCT